MEAEMFMQWCQWSCPGRAGRGEEGSEESLGQEEASSWGRKVAGRVRCPGDFKGVRIWSQKVAVTCRVTFWVERWGWKPSWQELSCEWEVSRGRSCERGGEMKESEDTDGAQGKAAFQAGEADTDEKTCCWR